MTVDRRIQQSPQAIIDSSKPFARRQRVEHAEDVRAVDNPFDAVYHTLAKKIIEFGLPSADRTGTGTTKLSGQQLQFDLREGFPLISSKYTWFKGVATELLWFRDGGTNVKPLQEHDVHIWDDWADENGDLGPVYGYQWRHWRTHDGREIDQLDNAVKMLRDNPSSRRNLVSAWNPSDVEELSRISLPPCHAFFQFIAHSNNTLDCVMYQRSADLFLGVPFNIASYALLTHMMSHLAGLEPGMLTVDFGDVHIYNNHREQFAKQLSNQSFKPPELKIVSATPISSIDDFRYEHFRLDDYNHAGRISAPIAV